VKVSIGDASERRKEVEELQRRLAVEEGQLQEQKGGIETELTEVQPMLDAARKAVGNIKSDNINEIRSLKMPPDAIRDVLEGVLRILGQQDMSWANMRKFLGSRAVKDEIVNFDAHKITPAIRKEVDKLLSAKGNSFEHAVIYRVSVAAAPMAAWVKANIRFSIVLEKIAPLERAMAGLNASLESSKQRLVECEAELGVLDQKVVELKEDFARKTGEAESLKIGLKRAQDTLGAAENLLGKLAGEKGRWVETVAALDAQIGELPLYSMMASAFAAYLPGHPEDVRAEVQAGWAMLLQVPPTYDFKRFMSSESEMLTWKAEGLPGDDLSMENGISILETSLSPLIIDPSTSASEWLKTHLTKSSSSSSSVEVATMHDPRCVLPVTFMPDY
jgi:dynein heavy chain 2